MQNDPLVGQQLGAYLIQNKLGEGGMARVYKAYHARLRRDVAIKVILPEVAVLGVFGGFFQREAQVIASLEHRNIVAVYDFGETGNLTYLVMQYVGGGTLREQLRDERPLDPRRAAIYALQMAQALHHAHQRGIVHRDVKPQNMLISANNTEEILLSDFGIAKMFNSRQDLSYTTQPIDLTNVGGNSSLTSLGQIVGTAEYMAPEQVHRHQIDARTDVYALGVVLYQMLSGQVPFHSTTVQGLLFQHVYTPPRPLREVNPNVPEVLAQIAAKAMAKAPDERFQSAGLMAQALEAIITPSTKSTSRPLTGPYGTNATLPAQSGPYQNYGVPSVNSSYYGSPTNSYGQSMHNSGVSMGPQPVQTIGQGIVAPPMKQKSRAPRISTILFGVVIVLALVAVLVSRGGLSWLNSGNNSNNNSGDRPYTASFSENFQDNHLNWTGNVNGLLASIANHTYSLKVTDDNTYFPHPGSDGSSTGPLPANFTLTVQIKRTAGSLNAQYGLAFRERVEGNHLYSYSLLIDDNGDIAFEKTTPGNSFQALWTGSIPNFTSGQSNKLQVKVQGNTFIFYINDTVVPIPPAADHHITDANDPLTGGQLGVAVNGTNASFEVSLVQLDLP